MTEQTRRRYINWLYLALAALGSALAIVHIITEAGSDALATAAAVGSVLSALLVRLAGDDDGDGTPNWRDPDAQAPPIGGRR